MGLIQKTGLASLILMVFASTALAEYRAYLIEVYDHILKKQWEATTGFSPDKYLHTHGGGNRLSVLVKATWRCWGDTSGTKKVCPMPRPKKPKFKLGDTVEVTLDKHLTQGWKGRIELSLYREDLKSNVYGLRFAKKRSMYNRYFEFNLKKAKGIAPLNTVQPKLKPGTKAAATQPVLPKAQAPSQVAGAAQVAPAQIATPAPNAANQPPNAPKP